MAAGLRESAARRNGCLRAAGRPRILAGRARGGKAATFSPSRPLIGGTDSYKEPLTMNPAAFAFAILTAVAPAFAEPAKENMGLPLVLHEDFAGGEKVMEKFEFT